MGFRDEEKDKDVNEGREGGMILLCGSEVKECKVGL